MHKNQIIIWLLSGFLITYHTVKIYSGLVESGDAVAVFTGGYYQNLLRLWIIMSLLLVIMFKKTGIYSMWLSISVLILIQYIQLTGPLQISDYLGPLKGFLIPLVISYIFWRHRPVAE